MYIIFLKFLDDFEDYGKPISWRKRRGTISGLVLQSIEENVVGISVVLAKAVS